jgi:beta-lactam-binding protein with PASTA domain
MRVCRACGRENPDDADFCTCGEYLRWEPTNFVEAAKPAPAASTDSAPTEEQVPAEVEDPNLTLAPEAARPVGARSGAAGGGGGAGLPVGAAADRGDAPPGAAALMLRLPDDAGGSEGAVETSVEPGSRTTIVGVIRNQSEVVDNFDLSVRGLPEGWWTVTPATAYLVPYGTGGTYEQEVQIILHPPRAPEAQARPWTFEVVAVSRAYGNEVAAAPATVTIGPYFEIGTELRPERGSGRLKARYKLTVRNKANARTEVAVAAEDTDGECQFRFAEPSVAIEPGNAIECPFTCFPPKQIWLGKTLERRFQVTAEPIGVELPVPQPPRMAVFRQRPWLPWWLAIVIPLLVVAAIVIISLLPKQTVVPNLTKASNAFAAQKLLNDVGLQLNPQTKTVVDPTKPPGAVADQSPKAGVKAKKGTVVSIAVYTGSGMVAVPPVAGTTPGQADQSLRASQLTLGAVSPQPLNPTGKIQSQIPLAGAKVRKGTAVAVFMMPPGAKGTAVAGKSGAGGAGGGGAKSGAKGAGAAAAGGAGAAALAAVAAQAGKGPIPVPQLTGDPTAAAGKLSQLGLVPVPINRLSTVPVGQLAGTVPAAGAKVAKGAQVDLLISSGSPQLSFDDGQAIHVINPTTGKQSGAVPAGVPPQIEASWSADGTHIVYSQAGQLMLDRPSVKGAVPKALTPPNPSVQYANPSFAPTPKAHIIAFVQNPEHNAKLCFATIGPFALNADCTGANGLSLGGQVDWSPDGSTILVLGSRNNGANFGLLAFTSNVPFSTHASDWGHGTLQTDASVPQHGVFAGAFSPDGKRMALVSNIGSNDYHLYVVPGGQFSPTPSQQIPGVRACQVSWRSDSQELAVMNPNGPCTPIATGQILGIDLSNPRLQTTLASNGAHPAWQPVAGGG